MNVGVFLENWSPSGGGGYTFQWDIFQSLVHMAAESRHNFTVFFPRERSGDVQATLKSSRIRVIAYSSPSFIEHAISRATREFQIIRKFWKRPGYFEQIARAAGVEFMWFVSPSHAAMDLPYITIIWDSQHRLQPWFPEVSANGIWEGRETGFAQVLRRAAAVIVGTETGRQEIKRFYQVPPDRIRLLPHPTPGFVLNAPPEDGDSVLAKFGIPEPFLFYPAQFWSHKNHANLLFAVRKLLDQWNLAFPVVFVGSDQGNETYVRHVVNDLGLHNQVFFLGHLPSTDLIGLYRNAFALTYMSFFGPENLPPLEAFALGCPVVASNVAGAEEQLGDAALLVDPRSPGQIASVIKDLNDNPKLRETLLQRGRSRAMQWTGHDFVRGVFSILDEFEPVRRCWGT